MSVPVRSVSLSRQPTPKRGSRVGSCELSDFMKDIQTQQNSVKNLERRIALFETKQSSLNSPKKTNPTCTPQSFKSHFADKPSPVKRPVKPVQVLQETKDCKLDLNNVSRGEVTWLSQEEQVGYMRLITERRYNTPPTSRKTPCMKSFTPSRFNKSTGDYQRSISELRSSLQQRREFIYFNKENLPGRKQLEESYLSLLKSVQDLTKKVEETRYENVILEAEINELRS